MPDAAGHDLSEEMLHCIEVCSDCHKACLQTVPHCLQMGGRHAEPNHIRLMMDCVEMLRGSDLHTYTCGACAEVCERCYRDCAAMGDDDTRMAACAEMCRRCAESCREMAAHAVHTI